MAKLSPRAAALMQQRERESAVQDGACRFPVSGGGGVFAGLGEFLRLRRVSDRVPALSNITSCGTRDERSLATAWAGMAQTRVCVRADSRTQPLTRAIWCGRHLERIREESQEEEELFVARRPLS